jgi:iron-sulfur cluster assembly protein
MATVRPRPQVMRLTEAAAARIKDIMAKAERPIAAVRVGDKGVRILIDPKAVLFLLGTEMDYRIEKLSAQFVFNNPNQTSACGCGESVQLSPAAEAIEAATPH